MVVPSAAFAIETVPGERRLEPRGRYVLGADLLDPLEDTVMMPRSVGRPESDHGLARREAGKGPRILGDHNGVSCRQAEALAGPRFQPLHGRRPHAAASRRFESRRLA